MDAWSLYEARMEIRGNTRREALKKRGIRGINRYLPDNLSYTDVTIDDIEQTVAIINSDNLDEKVILSMPGEDIRHGGLVYWMDNYWLVNERDANTTLYTRAKLLQCNYLLRWVSDDGSIHEQWCVVEDGTKYLTGELEDRNFIVTRGDSRIAITIAKNEFTAKLNRETRFIVDDPLSEKMLAYILSKPLKVGHTYDANNGIFKFVLQEVTATADDNFELRIADYYKYYPKREARTWVQATNPALFWTEKDYPEHEGDLWLYTGLTDLVIKGITIHPSGTYKFVFEDDEFVLEEVGDNLTDESSENINMDIMYTWLPQVDENNDTQTSGKKVWL